MRNIGIALLFIVSLCIFSSCNKPTLSELEQELIEQYLRDNNLDATPTPEGVYYKITAKGEQKHPDKNSRIKVSFKGKFLDNTVFVDNTDEEGTWLNLSKMIEGWRIGLPYFEKGSRGTLIIPSHLGFGHRGQGEIPGSTVIIYDIMLLDIE